MKKLICLLTLLITSSLVIPEIVYSQQRGGGRQSNNFERVETEKIAFITKELMLTPKEAQAFFPIYNSYRDEINKVVHSYSRNSSNSNKNNSSNSRKMDELARETQVLEIKKKYRKQFTDIVGASRASRFFEVEREFREKLINELRRRGGGDFPRNPSH